MANRVSVCIFYVLYYPVIQYIMILFANKIRFVHDWLWVSFLTSGICITKKKYWTNVTRNRNQWPPSRLPTLHLRNVILYYIVQLRLNIKHFIKDGVCVTKHCIIFVKKITPNGVQTNNTAFLIRFWNQWIRCATNENMPTMYTFSWYLIRYYWYLIFKFC